MVRVILTRPAGQSRAWQETLQSAGHEVLDWPLIETLAADSPAAIDQAWQDRAGCRAWMFVSTPAVHHFFARRPSGVEVEAVRCWATGPGTRRALLQCGVAEAQIDAPADDAPQFDTENLWTLVRPQVAAWPPGQAVAIVRGTEAPSGADAQAGSQAEQTGVGRDWLAEQLVAQGVQVRWVVAYQRGAPRWDPAQQQRARQALTDGSVWVFSSSLAVQYLAELLPQTSCSAARAVATHDRIAQVLRSHGWGQVTLCKPQASELMRHIASLELPA
jgi:uroporphyrinogen-III synthase